MQDIEPFFVADAVADFSLEDHKMAMTYAADRCAITTSTALLLDEWKNVQHTSDEAVSEVNNQGLTLQLVRKQVAELLRESPSTIDDNEDLIDRGLDSIRMMSLVEKWRSRGAEVTFMRLAEEPTIANWWSLLSFAKQKTLSHTN
jgi:bifunctional isochorismate lyase/aryl carrier protein